MGNLTHIVNSTLTTEHLTLRPLQRDDAPAMFKRWCADSEASQYLTWSSHGSLAMTQRVLDDWLAVQNVPGTYRWGIVNQGQLIGTIDVTMIHVDSSFEIGFVLAKSSWGHGFGTEAFHAVLDFLFNKVGYAKCTMVVHAANLVGRKIVESQAAVFDHIDRQYLAKQTNALNSVYFFKISKRDFNKKFGLGE